MRSIVVHYKELALKGRNRPWFVQVLTRNLKQALKGLDVSSVRSVMGRVEIDLGPAALGATGVGALVFLAGAALAIAGVVTGDLP